MDVGTLSVIVLIIINIAVAAFGYGKLNQNVGDLRRRIERLENVADKTESRRVLKLEDEVDKRSTRSE